MMMFLLQLAQYSRQLYNVDLELQYQLPIVLFTGYGLCSVMRLTVLNGKPKYALFILFTITYSLMWYILMLDNGIITRIMVVAIAIFGCLSGISPGVKYLLQKFKNLGDDNSFIR